VTAPSRQSCPGSPVRAVLSWLPVLAALSGRLLPAVLFSLSWLFSPY
jgi:hypothetical protein